MHNRDIFINSIPKPKNEDVILYDTSLKDLIGIDVYEEYYKLYPLFESKKNQYLFLKKKIEEYNKFVDNVYLLNHSWTEMDYLENLKNLKKTYSTVFNDIKKIETKIEVSQKKIKNIDDKIQIQTSKENKEIEKKKTTLYEDIEKDREKLNYLKLNLNNYKQSLSNVNNQINDNEEDFKLLSAMQEQITLGEYKCKYCGSTVKVHSENSPIFQRLYKNLDKNKTQLEKLLEQKDKLTILINNTKEEINVVKNNFNNNMQFAKENYNFYKKKSPEILKLEGLKMSLIKDVVAAKKQLTNNPRFNSKEFENLKDKINKNQLSLDNLRKIKDTRSQLTDDMKEYKQLESDLKKILNILKKYISFLTIYFKIYEQKANEFCGNNIKFKFFKFEEYKLMEILEITYDGVPYTELPNKKKDELDKFLDEKFFIYN